MTYFCYVEVLIFYIDEVCGTIPLTHQQNAEKVTETKKEARRRITSTSQAS